MVSKCPTMDEPTKTRDANSVFRKNHLFSAHLSADRNGFINGIQKKKNVLMNEKSTSTLHCVPFANAHGYQFRHSLKIWIISFFFSFHSQNTSLHSNALSRPLCVCVCVCVWCFHKWKSYDKGITFKCFCVLFSFIKLLYHIHIPR